MEPRRVQNEAMVEACRELYFKYGGREHRRIEAEMRAQGWTKFHRRYLTPRYRNGRLERPGWVDRFKWNEQSERRAKAWVRRAARRLATFEKWLEASTPGMKWTAPHHVHICKQLGKITRGETKRLMLFVPPRHGKSELVTIRYSAWRLAKEPGLKII
ncbi:MAG: hypothetical protein HOP17_07795, partial [Acidobacteria bacterium]|nr:hypothetical protein [Acidobacteriota bacterium]